jgi:hypothetical protein
LIKYNFFGSGRGSFAFQIGEFDQNIIEHNSPRFNLRERSAETRFGGELVFFEGFLENFGARFGDLKGRAGFFSGVDFDVVGVVIRPGSHNQVQK